MHGRRDYEDDELISAGLRVRGLLLNAIHQAAEKEKAGSTSRWLHHVVLEATAKALGVDPKTLDWDAQQGRFHKAPPPSPEAAAGLEKIAALLAIPEIAALVKAQRETETEKTEKSPKPRRR